MNLHGQLHKLYAFIPREKKIQLALLILLMVVVSLSDLISVGLIFPFMGILMDKNAFYEKLKLSKYSDYLEINNPDQLFDVIVIFFCGAVLITGLLRSAFVYTGSKVAFSTSADLGELIFSKMLTSDYTKIQSLNGGYIMDCIYNRSNIIANGIILPIVYFTNSLILCSIFFLAFGFIKLDSNYFIYVFFSLGLFYLVIILLTKQQKKINSKKISEESLRVVKIINESFGAIRDIIIGNHFDLVVKNFSEVQKNWRRAQANNQFLAQSPKFLIEALAICLIVVAAYIMQRKFGVEGVNLPAFAAIIFGVQKLIPVFQQAYTAFVTIQVSQPSLTEVLKILSESNNGFNALPSSDISFERDIEFRNVSFSYQKNREPIFNNISFLINSGSKIGIVGKSGVGKSTLIDMLMSLSAPTSGSILVDGVELKPHVLNRYRGLISHIPQSLYLSDESIVKNIAFGVADKDIDFQKILYSAKIAELSPELEGWPEGFYTRVGDRGSQLSGGQKQRIGIARAIYSGRKILILDEATSALDALTEKKVIENIHSAYSKATIVIITHRYSTLKYCDEIFEISDSKIKNLNINRG